MDSTARDDDRLRAEAALRASEERLRHIVEHAQDLIYYCDLKGHFTFVNPAAARVMKYHEEELLGRHFLTLIRPDYRTDAATLYTRQLAEGTPNTYFEFPAIAKNGEIVWIGQHVQVVYDGDRVAGVHAIARDITRQKDAEERLRRSEARYRSLIQGAAYGIFRTNVEGTILDANAALAQMLGYASVDELMTRNIGDIYKSPADRAALFESSRREGLSAIATDVAWNRKDGAEIIVHLSARVVDAEDGAIAFEGIAEDITEKRSLEEQLRRAQKMEAVGRLARGVAHDFNNVLAAILGTADLMLLHLKRDDPGYEDADEIRKAAERGAALTRQLLAFSRSQSLQLKMLDLNMVVPQLATMLQRLAGDGVAVRVRTADAPARVRIEPGQFEQVLLNLVVNARDAMPDGGTIDIELTLLTLDDRTSLHYSGLRPGAYVRLAVRDTGVGIDSDIQAHMFEPFFTTKGPKGTGLGLSIVYGIVRDSMGAVTFSTAPNKGTTFEVLLPLVA